MDKLFSLAGKHIFITGGAGLLGTKYAEAICDAGGTPILGDLKNSGVQETALKLSQSFSSKVIGLELDVTSLASVEQVFSYLRTQGIFVECLINNAARNPKVNKGGAITGTNRLESFDVDGWNLDLAVGLTGAVLCTRVFGAEMAKQGRGCIVNIASDLGVIAPDQRLYRLENHLESEQPVKPVSYSVIKHGIIGLTKYTATYWGHLGVRCNAISPGGVYQDQSEEFVKRISELIPLRRMAHANEYQGAIVFLCSDASSYMNGANLILDGGRSVW